MNPKIKNTIIFIAIAAVFVLIYFLFLRPSPEQANLVSSSPSAANPVSSDTSMSGNANTVTQNFLSLLLSVKSIKLDDRIFSDPGFNNLRDSSITLVPDGTEGRPNPFAPFGSDSEPAPLNALNSTASPQSNPASTTP